MRKRFSKIISALVIGCLAVSLLTGCGSKESSSTGGEESASVDTSEAATKDAIHVAVNAAPATFDLFTSTAMQAQWMFTGTVFESLVTINSNYEIKPELAESFTVSDDATTYTYKIRQGVKFHNGEEMTVADVIASLNHWKDVYADAAAVCGDSVFESTDDTTVTITLPTSYLYLNELMVKGSQRAIIVPESVIEGIDSETGNIQQYIGTGPYMFTEWETDRYILLTKFDDYSPYGEEGDLDGYYGYKVAATKEIYYDIVTDVATRTAGIQSGEYDFVCSMNVDDYATFNSDEYQIFAETTTQQLIMVYNKRAGIASDATIRQAVNAALNCDDILRAAYVEDDFISYSPSLVLQSGSTWYTEEGSDNYNQNDAEKAKELLRDAGYSGDAFRILVSNAYSDFYNAALVIQQNLESAGMTVELNVVDWATYQTLSKDETAFDAYITSCSIKSIPTQLYYLGESAGWTTDDSKLVELKEKINTSVDKDDAVATWKELQEYCMSEYVPVSILGGKALYNVSSTKVQNEYYFEGFHPWGVTVTE